jgi:virginiamycin B lyase
VGRDGSRRQTPRIARQNRRVDVWVALRRSGIVARVDPHSLRIVARVQVGAGPERLAIAGQTVWVLNSDDRTISRIDVRTNETRGAPISLGKELEDIAAGGGSLWVASSDRTLTRLNAATGAAIGTPIAVSAAPLALAADAGGVWVGSASDNTLTRVDANG